jgi:hypothetical protein
MNSKEFVIPIPRSRERNLTKQGRRTKGCLRDHSSSERSLLVYASRDDRAKIPVSAAERSCFVHSFFLWLMR